jgi:hypothetical protein
MCGEDMVKPENTDSESEKLAQINFRAGKNKRRKTGFLPSFLLLRKHKSFYFKEATFPAEAE